MIMSHEQMCHDIAVTHVTWTNASWQSHMSHEQMSYDITVTHGTWTYVSQQSQINVHMNEWIMSHTCDCHMNKWVMTVMHVTWTIGSCQSHMSNEQMCHDSHIGHNTECLPSTLTLLIYRFSKDWISWEFWNMVNCVVCPSSIYSFWLLILLSSNFSESDKLEYSLMTRYKTTHTFKYN